MTMLSRRALFLIIMLALTSPARAEPVAVIF